MECKICGKVFGNKNGLSKHLYKTHKTTSMEYTLKYLYDDVIPLCKCGCGKKVSYFVENPFNYREYAGPGHYANHHPDVWGDKSDPTRLAKSAARYKERYANGEIKHWSKGQTKESNDTLKNYSYLFKKENSPERAEKISNKLKGKKKSEEHVQNWKAKMTHYWESPEYREKLSKSHINHLINSHKQYTSKLETYFQETYLDPYNVDYTKFYYVESIKAFYDFYIPSLKIIIETDGDFWHCNPDIHGEPDFEFQKTNIEKDHIKNKWCAENDITILRFWENKIYDSPEEVLKTLIEAGIIPQT
jgi:very-short-patch-repair endonuclease